MSEPKFEYHSHVIDTLDGLRAGVSNEFIRAHAFNPMHGYPRRIMLKASRRTNLELSGSDGRGGIPIRTYVETDERTSELLTIWREEESP